jgi:hypothetical protein
MMKQQRLPFDDPARELVDIARAVNRLSPSWQRLELFHEQKSEISGRLRRLAGAVDGQPFPPLMTLPAAVKTRVVRVCEVRVVVLKRYLRKPPSRHRYPKPSMTTKGQGQLW